MAIATDLVLRAVDAAFQGNPTAIAATDYIFLTMKYYDSSPFVIHVQAGMVDIDDVMSAMSGQDFGCGTVSAHLLMRLDGKTTPHISVLDACTSLVLNYAFPSGVSNLVDDHPALRWVEDIEVTSAVMILHCNTHWICAEANRVSKTITIYDPTNNTNPIPTSVCDQAVRIGDSLGLASKHSVWAHGMGQWRVLNGNGPQQNSNYNCGPIACMNAISVATGGSVPGNLLAASVDKQRLQVL